MAAAVIWALYAFLIGRIGGRAFEANPWAGVLLDSPLEPRPCYDGQILLSAGTRTPPGTLRAAGQTLPIASNTALFSLLGTEYGGDGRTTFKLPNLARSAPDGLTYSICVQGLYPQPS
jgi:Phage Tail Collar Domain